jgi:transcriptional coactivator p15 (PC4)
MSTATVIATIPKNSREWVRVALDEYRGVNLIDIRVLVELNPETGLPIPTKKGVSLKVEKLPELIAALNDALVEAQRQGLLGLIAAE